MNGIETTYCIDTSALIDLKWVYPWVTFPTLWEKIGNLIKQGRLIAPQQVLKEIEKKDDELLKWLKKHKKMFKMLNQQQVDTAKDILSKLPPTLSVAFGMRQDSGQCPSPCLIRIKPFVLIAHQQC